MKIVSCHTADSKPIRQEVNSTIILPLFVFPGYANRTALHLSVNGRSCLSCCQSSLLKVVELFAILGFFTKLNVAKHIREQCDQKIGRNLANVSIRIQNIYLNIDS